MYFSIDGKALIGKLKCETIRIEPWGTDSFRVRATQNQQFTGNNWALTENHEVKTNPVIEIKGEDEASIINGKIKAVINKSGVLEFFNNGRSILKEYYRCYDKSVTKESCCLKIIARQYTPLKGGDYELSVRFESINGEHIYGMGQYQHEYLDQKGCILELAQRNSQISIPFALSCQDYGFLWNSPSVGRASFGKNYTEWHSECTEEMDYWITAGTGPADILEKYTAVTGRCPVMDEKLLGLWQCKLRYRTQAEVLEVARKYKKLGIHLDVIVIDFFHWIRQGEWGFDPEYWPDPKAMCDELHEMGTKVMVSVWPSVDRKSKLFGEMDSKGYLLRVERGSVQTYDFNGDCITFDATNKEAREFVWNTCKENYVKYGIDMFWLDNAEPDLAVYDFDNYRYQMGPALKVSNIYPLLYAKGFVDGFHSMGKENPVSLVRCAWAGSQKYGTLIWSGDVQSSFECLRNSVTQGLNMGMAGIPWWTTDIGGFMYGDVHDPKFIQLLERWFEFAVFTPVLRMHGDRDPHDIPPLSDKDFGGGYLFTGQPNEIWSYGEEAQKIMEKNLKLRLSLKDYIYGLMKDAHNTGKPLMRTMFFEFSDPKCWEVEDQYMFGPDYLVAPITTVDTFERSVYLPTGKWKNINDDKEYTGPCTISVKAPIDCIPVFKRM